MSLDFAMALQNEFEACSNIFNKYVAFFIDDVVKQQFRCHSRHCTMLVCLIPFGNSRASWILTRALSVISKMLVFVAMHSWILLNNLHAVYFANVASTFFWLVFILLYLLTSFSYGKHQKALEWPNRTTSSTMWATPATCSRGLPFGPSNASERLHHFCNN